MIFAAAGIWRPNSATVGKIRGAIVADPNRWEALVNEGRFKSVYGLDGESLKRAPRGVDPEHPLIDYLKLKSFTAGTTFTQDEACAPEFVDKYADSCRTAAPFMEFLCDAIGLNW